MKNIPMNCACGHINDIEHCLSCPLGGYVYLRHNSIRDLTANFLRMTRCKNIQIEPPLLPLTGEVFQYKSAITANDARLDRPALKSGCLPLLTIRSFGARDVLGLPLGSG